MARPLKPLVRGGGFYPSRKWTPLVYNGGYTTMDGGEEPEPLPIEKTVIGNPIHILDALAKPVQALSVKLEPIQDLHGYDNPWPAGGGKNLCDPSTIIVGFWDGTGAYSADVNYKTSGLIPVEPSTNYTGTFFKADKTEVSRLVYTEWDSSENFIRQSTAFDSFVTTANTAYVRIRNYNAQSSLITSNDFLYQFEKGSATAYAPYSNICPISGHTDADVTRTGKNLLDQSAGNTNNANWWIGSDAINAEPNGSLVLNAGTYTFSASDTMTGLYVRKNGSSVAVAYNNTKVTFTLTESTALRLMLYKAGISASYWDTVNIQLELSSTATSYSSYVGTTYPIPLGQTVYGGTLNVTSGKMVVEKYGIVVDGINHRFTTVSSKYWHITPYDYPAAKVAIGTAPALVYSDITSGASKWGTAQSGTQMFTRGSDWTGVFNSVDELNALGITVVYELATPQTIQLTPQQVELLQGENNLFSDGTMTLVYLADGNASDEEALNILLGGRYVNNHTEDEPTDREALNIIFGGNER